MLASPSLTSAQPQSYVAFEGSSAALRATVSGSGIPLETINSSKLSPAGTMTLGGGQGIGITSSPSAAVDDAAVKRSVKLPSSVPEATRGERPYYHEGYFKYCTGILATRESAMVTETLLNASAAFFSRLQIAPTSPSATLNGAAESAFLGPHEEGAAPSGPLLRWNALVQQHVHDVPLAAQRWDSTWDDRALLVRRLQESLLPTCEEAVFAMHRLFRGRQPFSSDLVHIENTTSMISQSFGALIHVWQSTTEAKKFVQSQAIASERASALRLCTLAVPVTVHFIVHTVSVTATPLLPLINTLRVTAQGVDPQLYRQLRQLEMYGRSRSPLSATAGGDGLWYVVDCLPFLRVESESQGETNNVMRHQLFDVFPNMDDFPDTLRKAGRRAADWVIGELLDATQRIAENSGSVAAVKIHDLVSQRVFPTACHKHGYKVSYAYELIDHPRLTGSNGSPIPPTANLVKELLYAEMVCRSIKELIRAEVATIRAVPHPEAPVAAVSQYIVEMANRCVFNVLTKEDLWVPHVVAVLRIKFTTPETFSIAQGAVTKRTILGYLTSRLGLVFEGGRYCRLSHVVVGCSLPVKPSCPVTALLVEGKRDAALALVQQLWKRSSQDIANPELQAAACRHRLMQFAIMQSAADVDASIQAIEKMLNDRSADLATRGDMQFASVEAALSLCEPRNGEGANQNDDLSNRVRLRKHMDLFVKRFGKSVGQSDNDTVIALHRYRMLISASAASVVVSSSASEDANDPHRLAVEEQNDLRIQYLESWLHVAPLNLKSAAVSEQRRPSSDVDVTVTQSQSFAVMPLPTSMRLYAPVMLDSMFDCLMEVFQQLFMSDGRSSTCSLLLSSLSAAKSERARYAELEQGLVTCGVLCIGSQDALPPPQRDFFLQIAEEALQIARKLYQETELPFFCAFLVLVSHVLGRRKSELPLRQAVDSDGFMLAVQRLLKEYETDGGSALRPQPTTDAKLWKSLKSEDFLSVAAAACQVLMDINEWKYAKMLLAFTHHVVCEGKVDGYSRITQPAHPCLKEAAMTMRAAMQAVQKFQTSIKRSLDARRAERDRNVAALRKRQNSGFNKTMLYGKPLPTVVVLRAAKECHEVSMRSDIAFVPRIKSLEEFATGGCQPGDPKYLIVGLRTLLAAAPSKPTPAMCAIAMQSGYFPPVKFAVLPFVYGHRHLVVCPDTQCIGLFWSKLWCIPAKMGETNVPLYAKIAAWYIGSQVRFTHLFFSIVGFGWAGPIAQALGLMIPQAELQSIITFGSPAAFSNARGVTAHALHGHYMLEDDLTPHLVGCSVVPHILQRVVSKLDGLGVLMPLPLSKRQMTSMSLYGYYGDHIFVFEGRGSNRREVDRDIFATKTIDLRKQFVGVTPLHYVETISAFAKQFPSECDEEVPPQFSMHAVALSAMEQHRGNKGTGAGGGSHSAALALVMGCSLSKPWYPPDVPLMRGGDWLQNDGTPTDKLRQTLRIPRSVESNVLLPEHMLLSYPKVTDRIIKGLLTLGDDYGFESDGQQHQAIMEKLTKCRTSEQLVFVLQGYMGAAWCPELLAAQLLEWSGVVSTLQRQPISPAIIEAFVTKHSFLFTMCADTVSLPVRTLSNKGSASASPADATPIVDKISRYLTEDDKAVFAGPLGYHVGWCVAVAKTSLSVDTARVVQALLGAVCQQAGIADVHPRTGKQAPFAPAIRFTFTPPAQKGIGGAIAAAKQQQQQQGRQGAGQQSSGSQQQPAVSVTPWLIVQWNLLELVFDGSNAAQSHLRAAEQCLWVVQDDFSLQHFINTVDCSDPSTMRQILVFACPSPPQSPDGHPAAGPAAPAVNPAGAIAKAKSFAEAHHLPFFELYPHVADSVSSLVTTLMRDIGSNLKMPLNPSVLPKGVHVGSLYREAEDEVTRQIKKGMSLFIKPNTPPNGSGNAEEEKTIGRRGMMGTSNHVANVMSLKPQGGAGKLQR